MRLKWQRIPRLASIAIAVAAAIVAPIAVERIYRVRPNYSQIEEGVWLGGSVAEPPPGTQAVLNLCEAKDPYLEEFHRWAPIADAAPAPSLQWLREQVEFVEEQRKAHRALYIHCMQGVSRSTLVLAAYLMKREGWSRDEALAYIRSKRPRVQPNPAFMSLLLEWEQILK